MHAPQALRQAEQASAEFGRVLEWDPARIASKRSVEGARVRQAAAAASPPPHKASPRAVPDTLSRDLCQDMLDPPLAGASVGSCRRSGRRSSTRVDSKAPDEILPPVLEHVVMERCDASVTVWFNVVSAQWNILQATGCTEIFWGRGHQLTELGNLVRWIHPDVRETLIFWVQATFQNVDSCAQPRWQTHEEAVYFRPPLLRASSASLSASVTIALPAEQDRFVVQMRFDDIRLTNACPRS